MLYPSINEIRKKADSRYTLVILAAQRARDIIDGKPSLLDEDIERPVSIAAREIANDYLTYKRPDPAEEAALEAAEEGEQIPEEQASESEETEKMTEETESADADEAEEKTEETQEQETEEEFVIDQEED